MSNDNHTCMNSEEIGEKPIKDLSQTDMFMAEGMLRAKNLKVMQEIEMMEHLNHTQIIKKVCSQIIEELTQKGHTCVSGSRFTAVEVLLAGIKEDVAESRKENKTIFAELYEGMNKNSKRIDRIETIGGIAIFIGGTMWAVFIWVADKVTWK